MPIWGTQALLPGHHPDSAKVVSILVSIRVRKMFAEVR